MPASVPSIALSICTYSRYDLLPKAIASAVSQTLPAANFEIIIVDNSPDHDNAEAYGNTLTDIENLTYVVEETSGLSNARNVAARIAQAPIIAYLDDDAVATTHWAEEILAAFAAFGPRTSIVGGRVEPIWEAPRPPWLHDSLLASLSVVDWGGESARLAAQHEWLVGANIAFRVEAIRRYGGFSTNLGRKGSGGALMSNEESQLVEKIRAMGELVVYAPKASVGHLVESKRLRRSWFRKRMAWQAVSDFTLDPAASIADARKQWDQVARYFNRAPPLERTMRGLYYETDDPDVFRWQIGAIYSATLAMLAGFEGVEVD
jgi:glycosyltransferase involved in cell wall biosynthesis